MRIVFMGSPDFAVPTLLSLHRHPAMEVALVVTQPDRPAGRGRREKPTAVKVEAERANLPVAVMSKDSYDPVAERVGELGPDFIVVAAFGLILKKDLLTSPRRACVNLHPSLLPRYRGMSPIQAALLAGDEVTGCTTMLMDERVDAGEILLQREVLILPGETAGSLSAKLARVGAGLVVETLVKLEAGVLVGREQDEAEASYTRKIRKEDGRMDWNQEAEYLERLVRALDPWPRAFTFFRSRRLIVTKASPAPGRGEPGTVLSTSPLEVACASGALRLLRVKPEGKKEMTAEEFVAGYNPVAGERLGE